MSFSCYGCQKIKLDLCFVVLDSLRSSNFHFKVQIKIFQVFREMFWFFQKSKIASIWLLSICYATGISQFIYQQCFHSFKEGNSSPSQFKSIPMSSFWCGKESWEYFLLIPVFVKSFMLVYEEMLLKEFKKKSFIYWSIHFIYICFFFCWGMNIVTSWYL